MTFNNSSDNLTATTSPAHGDGDLSGTGGVVVVVVVEAYSVVLSATALVLSAVLGGGGSLAILLAVFRSRQVRKYSYTLLLVFFFLCCGLALLWAPLELAHLLTYHHTGGRSPTQDFAVATFSVYVFLLAGLAILVAAFCAENVLRMGGVFGPALRHAWPLSVCLSMLVLCLLMALAFLSTSLHRPSSSSSSSSHRPDPPPPPLAYLVLHDASSASRVAILLLLMLMVGVGALAVGVAGVLAFRRGAMKNSESFLSARSAGSANAVPQFLVNRTGAGAGGPGSGQALDKLSLSASSAKLPDVAALDVTPATPVKAPGKLGDLPGAPAPRGPSMLGVNMAQVLGRRRHTICQIGDSSAQPDPTMVKAKQYNYVRKFSVDISALQAQLENPKLFKDSMPFASHQDLRHKPQQQDAPNPPPLESRAPLLPLPDLKPPRPEQAEPGGGGGSSIIITLPVPPPRPPVITVSEDVREDTEGEIQEEEEEDKEEGGGGGGGVVGPESGDFGASSPENRPAADKVNLTDIQRLPVTQPVDEEDEDEEEEGGDPRRPAHNPGGEDDGDDDDDEEEPSYKSQPNTRLSEREQEFVKMTCLLTLTFFLCTFPLSLVEALRTSLHPHTYVNVSTCARALSVIQTIIYPHVVLCMDRVVRRAVRSLRRRWGAACRGLLLPGREGVHVTPEHDGSSSSQM